MSLNRAVETANLTEIVNMEGGGGYDWSQMKVWYSEEEARFFWLSDHGCSCNYFGMGVYNTSQLENGSKDDARRALTRFKDSRNEYSRVFSPATYLRAQADLMNVKVRA